MDMKSEFETPIEELMERAPHEYAAQRELARRAFAAHVEQWVEKGCDWHAVGDSLWWVLATLIEESSTVPAERRMYAEKLVAAATVMYQNAMADTGPHSVN